VTNIFCNSGVFIAGVKTQGKGIAYVTQKTPAVKLTNKSLSYQATQAENYPDQTDIGRSLSPFN